MIKYWIHLFTDADGNGFQEVEITCDLDYESATEEQKHTALTQALSDYTYAHYLVVGWEAV